MSLNNSLNNIFPITLEELNQLQNIIKNFSSTQLAWLSGYFWKISNENIDHKKTHVISENIVTIISASQTGNAKQIATELYIELQKCNMNVALVNANEYKFKNIYKEKILILITSTQGEGEPPEEAVVLYNYLMSKKAPKLKETKFSVFGLGDRSYPKFSKIGKDFDNRLSELGGVRLLERVDADIDYEQEAKTWKKEISSKLLNIVPIQKKTTDSISNIFKTEKICIYNKNNPYLATVISNQKITGRYSEKDIRHIEIDLSGSNIHYAPGSSIGVWYENDISLVEEFLDSFSLNGNEILLIKNLKVSLTNALKKYFELTVNTSMIVKKYAYLSKNKILLSIISDQEKLNKYVSSTPLIDMIQQAKTLIKPEQLLTLLRPLKPRYYSISSSQIENENEAHITVSIVRYQFKKKLRTGGASGYLANIKEDANLKIFVAHNKNFFLPSNTKTPIIMVGVGTGIAPFRAFVQERDHRKDSGKNWLFFGNPNFSEDFLYQIEWQYYLKKKILTKIDLAWSRDQKEKIYVQNKIFEQGAEIWHWITKGAQIYVCGHAYPMAKNVERTFIDIFIQYGNMKEEIAESFLHELRSSHRYQRDVY